tara:strand:- start:791 stop:1048 length:258 start_codon:yes stop_codon:yes gene_type:complete
MDDELGRGPQDDIFIRKLVNLDREIKTVMDQIAWLERNQKLIEAGLLQGEASIGQSHGTLLDYSQYDWKNKGADLSGPAQNSDSV